MSIVRYGFVALILLAGAGVLGSCGDENDSIGDVTPPAAITDLVVGRPLGNSLTVAWTATGDDSTDGLATYYDLRYSKIPIDAENWSSATPYPDADPPFRAGVFQGCQVIGLEPEERYYFAIRAADERHNWSSLSNVVSAVTVEYTDSIPPSPIIDLTVDSTSPKSVTLSWTAPGDDGDHGIASFYDARFSILPITDLFDWNFSARLTGEPLPAVAGTHQSITVTGLTPNRELYFAIRAGDEITNWSGLSPQVLAKTRPAETVPPAPITDLRVGLVSTTSVELIWTAPGDDSLTGMAAEYDMRFDFYPITEQSWATCSYVLTEPAPAPAGAEQSITISTLGGYRRYYFAIKTADDVPNWSALSNVVTFITVGEGSLEDTIAPSPVTDLSVLAASRNALTIRWREVGDDFYFGNPSLHDLRYSTDSITEANWGTARIVDYVIPTRPAGTFMTMDIRDLQPGTTYFIAIKTADEVPNWSELSNVAWGTTRP